MKSIWLVCTLVLIMGFATSFLQIQAPITLAEILLKPSPPLLSRQTIGQEYSSRINVIPSVFKKGFTISGHITGIKDSTQIMLQNLSNSDYLDSTRVINSHFLFKGQPAEEPEELRIISGLEELKKGVLFYTDLLIGNEEVTLSADLSDLPYNVRTPTFFFISPNKKL